MSSERHECLVKRAEKWLLGTGKCTVAFTNIGCGSHGEIADAIGFGPYGESILVECKVSRSDFLSDKKKPFRQLDYLGVGDFRYYLTMPGVFLKESDLPDLNWGVLEVRGKTIRKIRKAKKFENAYKHGEVHLLRCAYHYQKEGATLPLSVLEGIPSGDQ